LQILARKPLLRELDGDGMQALGAERELVVALRIVPMGLPQRLQRCN
jgi:hypothetical protein